MTAKQKLLNIYPSATCITNIVWYIYSNNLQNDICLGYSLVSEKHAWKVALENIENTMLRALQK